MVTYAFDNEGLPVYDARGRNLIVIGGNTYDVAGTRIWHFNAAGEPCAGGETDPAGPAFRQPPLVARLQFLMSISGPRPFTATAGAIRIAMTPARASRDPIDYTTKTGSSLYDRATKSLFTDTKDAYDLKSDGLMNFLDAINRRGRECGWEIFTINNTAGEAKSLLTEYGDLTIENVLAHATTVLQAAPITRSAQEEGQLFACINNSMTQGAIDVLNLRQDKFLIPAPVDEYSGTCFLRVIIAEAQVDTRATTNLLLGQLTSGLPDIMAKEGGNVKSFNLQVLSIIRRVKRRGTDPGSILPQLLRVYTSVDDKEGKFARYIENLNNNYIDGTINLTDVVLMSKAEAKYEELCEDDAFEIANKKDDTIMALQTQVEALSTELTTKKKSKEGGRSSEKGPSKKVPDWMNKAPKSGEPKTKTKDGKTYHWCDGYGTHKPRWVIHKVDKCRGYIKRLQELGENNANSGDDDEEEPEAPSSESPTRETQRRVGWSTTMLAQVQRSAGEDSE